MQIKKIISITLILIVIITTMCVMENTSNASTYLIDEADLYSKGQIICLMYKDIRVGVEFVVYKKDGVEYPAYCLNRNLPGVTESEGYTVSVTELVTDTKIWRAINNGYPFVSPEELGCNSDIEAFAATKMAVYDMMYNYDWDDFSGINKQGERVLNAAIQISKAARSSTETKITPILKIETSDTSWEQDQIDSKYVSKTFSIKANAESTKYTVNLNNVNIQNVKIVDKNNQEKTEFSSSEEFKILIPISEMIEDGSFEIEITADMKTKPILYGESADSSKQSYALAAGDYEYESVKLEVNYLTNSTKLEIIKKDTETQEALAGAKFNILNENMEIVYTELTTDDNGMATIEGIMPGKYYIQEVKSPDGYIIYDELIELDIKLNEQYTIDINNLKEPQEKEEKNITYKTKEIALPRTGF